jgi:hypothetical protein
MPSVEAGTPTAPSGLGFVALDEFAKSLVQPVAAVRAERGGGIVIPLFSNLGFLPFLRNLLCSMQRLEVNNWVVIAMDNGTCPALGVGDPTACVYPYSRSSNAVTSSKGVATYRSVDFNRMVMQRPLWIRWLLRQGYSVIQCDLDIVWLRDPQPLLHSMRSRRCEGCMPDLVFQSEQAYGLNGGFYFARPTNATLTFYDYWLERLSAMISMPSFEEQHALNSALQRMKKTSAGAGRRLIYEQLHDIQFPNGKIWWSYPWLADKRQAFLVHANWNKAQKKSRMVRDRLWFLTDGDGQCDASFDPLMQGCSKLCAPVAYSAPGGARHLLKKCADLNKEDDYHARKQGGYYTRHNYTWANLRGQFWHPMAYAALPGCTRNLSRVAPFATMAHEKLAADAWAESAPLVSMAKGATPAQHAKVAGTGNTEHHKKASRVSDRQRKPTASPSQAEW